MYRADEKIRNCYFPTGGLISLFSMNEEGETLEVASIGNEGMLGVSTVLQINSSPFEATILFGCAAWQIKTEILQNQLMQTPTLHTSLQHYLHALICQISQSTVCLRYHNPEQRFCRWVLTACQRARINTLKVTHETVAQIIGLPRTSVTAIATRLETQKLIKRSRGQIEIVNRLGLEDIACKCRQINTIN